MTAGGNNNVSLLLLEHTLYIGTASLRLTLRDIGIEHSILIVEALEREVCEIGRKDLALFVGSAYGQLRIYSHSTLHKVPSPSNIHPPGGKY